MKNDLIVACLACCCSWTERWESGKVWPPASICGACGCRDQIIMCERKPLDVEQPFAHVLEDSVTGLRYTVVLTGTFLGTANRASAYVAARTGLPRVRLQRVNHLQEGDVFIQGIQAAKYRDGSVNLDDPARSKLR